MNRRRSDRYTKRVEVQFWQRGQKVERGYSTNISASGMHIATTSPLPPQSRLRIEVMHGDRCFLVEGVVAHRRTVHPELAKVTPPGMGVRFLSPGELVQELFPQDVGSGSAARSAGGERQAGGSGREIVEGEPELRSFSVRFASARDFIGVYERDIVNGGLFVATSRPGRLREIVRIELYPPGPAAASVQLTARVVQRFEPEPGSGAILVGMGVELIEPLEALGRLRPIVERLAGMVGQAPSPGLG
jgi:PilZ domain